MSLCKICPEYVINQQVAIAILEDMQILPDYTTQLLEDKSIQANIHTKENLILCGSQWVNQAFLTFDKYSTIKWFYKDGDHVQSDTVICEIAGSTHAIVKAERCALNFLQTLSGTSTLVNQYVKKVAHTNVKIMDTRKTIPGLRLAQKYAVVTGGGHNQRIGLYDGVLIKENHIVAANSIKNVLEKAFRDTPKHIPIQIEVETKEQLIEAIDNGAKLILLDNMSPKQIHECVKLTNGRAELEASGNITLDNVITYAETGVDRISIGSLTKNVRAIDLSLRVYN